MRSDNPSDEVKKPFPMNPPILVCPGLLLFLLHPACVISRADETRNPPTACVSALGPSSWKGPAPPLPILPLQYSMKVEANIVQNGWTTEVEEHFDSVNQRASVSLTRNGTTTISIFDFKAMRRYDIYENSTCRAGTSGKDLFGFVTTNKQNRPVMATVNEVFRFGSQFNITYVAQEKVRGIPVSHWTSCQTWTHLGAKFQLDYYFSARDYTTASGQSEIPVRAILNGEAQNVDSSNGHLKGVHTFQHIYEFNSFRAGPVLNEDVFQIPPGIFCGGMNDNRPLPEIPSQVELSLEVVVPGRTRWPLQEYLIYDFRHKLQETVTTDSDDVASSLTKARTGEGSSVLTTLISVVRDYRSGLAYMTEMTNLTCTVKPMAVSSMYHGAQLLAVSEGSSKFVYQGQTTFRDMLVDVWGTEQSGVILQVYFLPGPGLDSFHTMLGMFLKNRSSISASDLPALLRDALKSHKSTLLNGHDDVDPGRSRSSVGAPTGDQLAWGLQLEHKLDQHTSQKIINIFHYRPLRLGLDSFQVSQCYPESEMSRVVLFVNADYATDVSTNFLQFVNSVRDILAQKLKVSILHISSLALTPHKLGPMEYDTTRVTFTLLGATSAHGSQHTSIRNVKDNLTAAIANGITFRLLYNGFFKSFTINKEMYFIDYDQKVTPKNSKFSSETKVASLRNDPKNSSRSDHRYSQGTVAGIAIVTMALAALLCLGIIVLVFRRRKPGEALVSHPDTG